LIDAILDEEMSKLKFLKECHKYFGYRKKINGSLKKVSSSSKVLIGGAKGKPDPDKLRKAILGSPLAKEIVKLNSHQKNLEELASSVRNSMPTDGLPDFTFADLAKLIKKKPTLEQLQKLRGNMQGAHDILLERFTKLLETQATASGQYIAVSTVLGAVERLDKALTVAMKVPKVREKVQGLWFDIKMSILPTIHGIRNALNSVVQTVPKIGKTVAKKIEFYKKMVTTLEEMIRETEVGNTA
jgi:hypothetical protein